MTTKADAIITADNAFLRRIRDEIIIVRCLPTTIELNQSNKTRVARIERDLRQAIRDDLRDLRRKDAGYADQLIAIIWRMEREKMAISRLLVDRISIAINCMVGDENLYLAKDFIPGGKCTPSGHE